MFDIAQHRVGPAAFPAKADHKIARSGDWGRSWPGLRGGGKTGLPRLRHLARPAMILSLLAALAACSRAPTEDILRGGVPARTDLHQTTALPPESIRSVARKDAGWRLIYHPARAPVNAEQSAAAALCRLEKKRPEQLIVVPMSAPEDDPGARMIDVICR